MRPLRTLFALLLCSAAWSLLAVRAAQMNIRVDTTLVVVPVSVTDAQNRFVLGLEKSDFQLLEDGSAQNVKQFADENAPISVGLLVDISGSMGSKVDLSREAVKQFLKTLDAQDEAALIQFGDTAAVAADFTRDATLIEDKLAHVEPQGLTALLDAVSLGLDEMKKAKNTRKALIIISDGGDNHSRYTTDQIKELVRKADVQVYSMGVYERFPAFALSAAELTGPRLLKQLSEQTGGRAFSASDADELPAIAERIGIELRNQYVLAYSPSNRKKDGTYRHLEVKVKEPPGLPPLKARWRAGYYAPVE
ncbi:MAG TPA: VWA domain-containing protein [Bryobacteraceae bacterium]|jgi:Ca-activated chloride channel family protein|nr:VWA domain-containing protein [Bryobacteraceae bacterium]